MAAGATLVFGMMRAAQREFAVSADAIQEVVAWPDHVTLPLRSSDLVRGLFDLRGQAVPIVALNRLLGSDAPTESYGNVAVLRTQQGRLGLAIDNIGGIVRASGAHIQSFAGAADTTLMRGLLRTSADHTVPILDETALASLPGLIFLPAVEAESIDAAQRPLCAYLVFACGAFRFGVDATCVREIIDAPEIEMAALRTDLYRGKARVRGGITAVVDLLALLSVPDAGAVQEKLLVLELDGAVVGLTVSDIVGIQRRRDADILGVPAFGTTRRDLIVGLLAGAAPGPAAPRPAMPGPAAPAEPDVIVLSHAAILNDPEVSSIRRLHAEIAASTARASTKTAAREAYLKVAAGHSLHVKLSECAEIVPMPERAVYMGPTGATYLGLMRRGTQTWPLIRLRMLMGGPDESMPASARVLLADGAHGAFGFVVDCVQAIEYLAIREDLGSTMPLGNAARQIWADSPDGPRMHLVVDLNALAARLAATGANAA
jgi:purine-binding chemotaxis protein CheW